MLTFGSLFAGIGGFDLGFERAGMQCRWHVESDPYCQAALRYYWPYAGQWDDVRTFPPTPASDWYVDVLCGGFPCQDISNAGYCEGIEGEQSGLWREFYRIICELRPGIVVVENVSALLGRGLDRVLGNLAASRYDAEWDCLPAAAFGAPHERDRAFIVAYSKRRRLEGRVFGCTKPGTIQPSAYRRTSLGTFVGETWGDEPPVSLLDDGLSGQLAEASSRLTGNAVVPQIAEWIGRRIVETTNNTTHQRLKKRPNIAIAR